MKHAALTTALTCALGTAVQASSVEYAFCWIGDNGYTMEGRMQFDDALLETGLISQDDITRFEIRGYRDDAPLGSWSLAQLTPETTWVLSFDTTRLEFPTGSTGNNDLQAWNADGTASNCGNPGFGFNAGNNAQDVCVNGEWRTDSMVDRFTPLQVFPAGSERACGDPDLLSQVMRPKREERT
ncbi:hypothetical protein [Actibacterium sp. 188UL27-1]|uniref:hypothetical protein n=1 Tax=Actibacterium sp. 188UL27-1 TaxID=2786961 RepID=UPI001958EDFE|nr:hypothetical protein [Actibacterium sp. 188UL27-1]MBM7069062.1 hypothetical protein [Actibacterium sp. 188UL27-1]